MSNTKTHQLDGAGSACAVLTPLIHRAIRELNPGDLLTVTADDPVAREGVTAWCRLTGHELVEMLPIDERRTSFLLRKKSSH